ncbi:hypothetical protein [Microcoleus sp. bin38.metabat.b11b12b14.051]|nr:hypothetical protein [Microcoleus sp. bin38.metabat.b11b12b14.051]
MKRDRNQVRTIEDDGNFIENEIAMQLNWFVVRTLVRIQAGI